MIDKNIKKLSYFIFKTTLLLTEDKKSLIKMLRITQLLLLILMQKKLSFSYMLPGTTINLIQKFFTLETLKDILYLSRWFKILVN